jgi:hypothetical protein
MLFLNFAKTHLSNFFLMYSCFNEQILFIEAFSEVLPISILELL